MVSPLAMLALAGVAAIDTNVAEVTVRAVLPERLPLVAVIVVLPAVTELARPCVPAALLIVATPVLLDVQVTSVVRFCVELSE